ncbi:MAG: hypothetical protein WC306_03420 [Candidatus Paceibacterota bacterium]|jgi:hypothetical protein
MSSSWDNIVSAIKTVLEETSANDLNVELKYAEHLIVADNLAGSIFNGSYFIKLRTVNQVDDSVNRRLVASYQAEIDLCYEISAGDTVTSYNESISDIEIIIKNMLQQSAWSDYSDIQYVRFVGVDTPTNLVKGNIFQIIPVTFAFDIIIEY